MAANATTVKKTSPTHRPRYQRRCRWKRCVRQRPRRQRRERGTRRVRRRERWRRDGVRRRCTDRRPPGERRPFERVGDGEARFGVLLRVDPDLLGPLRFTPVFFFAGCRRPCAKTLPDVTRIASDAFIARATKLRRFISASLESSWPYDRNDFDR